jgi:microcystin degradation protein MlrC
MAFRVALMGITHESNTFVNQVTTLEHFRKGHWMKGEALLNEYRPAFHEIGGMIEVLEQEHVEILPVMYAEATPGGTVSADTYKALLQELLQELETSLPVDGCLVVPHGAGVSENFPDMDGHWLNQIRERVGNDIPVIGTLDPHANVSELMASSTDALIAYKTNPHVDQRETGRAAAKLMINTLKKDIKPVQHLLQLPLAISIEQQHTGSEPCKSLYEYASRLNMQEGILSISILLGFPYADVKEMGSSVIVVTDNNPGQAVSIAEQLKAYVIKNKKDFKGSKLGITDSLALIERSKKPVLMLDMGDNVGGGSPGNSTFLLKALEQQGRYKSFICIYDPYAVMQARKHSPGERFEININRQEADSERFNGRVVLARLADGKFKETKPRHGGQVSFDMGEIAIVVTEKGNTIMLTSLRTPPFSLCQLISFGIDPQEFDVIVAKGVNAPIAAYSQVCPTVVQVNSPGVTQADMTKFDYNNRRKPLFPFEEIEL